MVLMAEKRSHLGGYHRGTGPQKVRNISSQGSRRETLLAAVLHKNDFRCISISKSIGKGRGCMQEENDHKTDLEEVLASLRETAGENRESLKNRYEYRAVKQKRRERRKGRTGNGGKQEAFICGRSFVFCFFRDCFF